MKIFNSIGGGAAVLLIVGWSACIQAQATIQQDISVEKVEQKARSMIAQRCEMSASEFAWSTVDIRTALLYSDFPASDKLRLKLLLAKPVLFGEQNCNEAAVLLIGDSSDTSAISGLGASGAVLMTVNNEQEFMSIRKMYAETMIAYAEKLGAAMIPDYKERRNSLNIMPQKVVNGRVVYLPGPSGANPDAYTGEDRAGYLAALKQNAENGRMNYEQSELREKLDRIIPGIRKWLTTVYKERAQNDAERDAFLARLDAVRTK